MNTLDLPGPRYCAVCGHRADLPRAECDCRRCTATPEEQRAEAGRDMAALLLQFNDAGGDLSKLLEPEHPE